MTDSDDSFELPNDVFTFQNGSTSVRAKGPNINTNFSCLSFRNTDNMSSLDVRQNCMRPRYAESAVDHRSVYSRRETSPMSLRSASGLQARNYHSSFYRGGMSSQRSMYNGRSRSPMSVRTNVSNVSAATDIVTAIVTNQFNRKELLGIKNAIFSKLKHRDRNRVRKRRNNRMFLKNLNRSGGESGEQGSNSSISDDDCHSIRSYRTTGYKECKPSHYRSARSNLSEFRRTIQESNMYRDCTDSLKQNSFRSILSVPPAIMEESTQARSHNNNTVMIQRDRFKNGFLLPSQRFNQSVASSIIPEKVTQWQRKNEFYQNGNAFNRKRAEKNRDSVTDSEQEEIFSEKVIGKSSQSKRGLDDDDIGTPNNKRSKMSTSPKVNAKHKAPVTQKTNTPFKGNGRSNDFVFAKPQFPLKKWGDVNKKGALKSTQLNSKLDSMSSQSSNIKKIRPPAKGLSKGPRNIEQSHPKSQQPADTNILSESYGESNDSVFIKPQFPLRKTGTVKNKRKVISKSTQLEKESTTTGQTKDTLNTRQPTESSVSESLQPTEKLISKSCQPLEATVYPAVPILPQNDIVRDQHKDMSEMTQHNTIDMSMRPSFIKRKLFSQKVDLAENKNYSSENLDANSPQPNIYSAMQKEKSKTRKLTTSQSCLNRDVFGEDSNLLELIHKIVPPDRMNLTTATNRSEVQSSKSKPANADKWDISKVIATCDNADDVSETYTDEEIFKADNEDRITAPKKRNDEKQNKINQCAVVLEILPQNVTLNKENGTHSREQRNDCTKRSVFECVKSFWDTDSECETNFGTSNQGANGKCNQKQTLKSVVSDHIQAPKESISKKNGKENNAPVAENVMLPKTKLIKSAQIVKKNNKKTEITEYPNTKFPSNKTVAVVEENNNTESETLSNSKITLNKIVIGVKSVQKPKDDTKIIPNNVKTGSHKQNITLKPKQTDKIATQECNINKTKKNNLVLKNVDDTSQKSNNSLSVRPTRMARLKLCCYQSSDTEKSINDTSTNESAVYRSLRSREIDISSSLQSDKETTLNKDGQIKNVGDKKNHSRRKVEDKLELSDVSFTLTTDNKRPSRLRNNISRQSDTSFSLTSDKPLKKTAYRKSIVDSKDTKTKTIEKSIKNDSLANSKEKGANTKFSNTSKISKGKGTCHKKR